MKTALIAITALLLMGCSASQPKKEYYYQISIDKECVITEEFLDSVKSCVDLAYKYECITIEEFDDKKDLVTCGLKLLSSCEVKYSIGQVYTSSYHEKGYTPCSKATIKEAIDACYAARSYYNVSTGKWERHE